MPASGWRSTARLTEVEPRHTNGSDLTGQSTPGGVHSKPPLFGAATRAVLADSGYSESEIESLIGAGIAYEEGPKPPT